MKLHLGDLICCYLRYPDDNFKNTEVSKGKDKNFRKFQMWGGSEEIFRENYSGKRKRERKTMKQLMVVLGEGLNVQRVKKKR